MRPRRAGGKRYDPEALPILRTRDMERLLSRTALLAQTLGLFAALLTLCVIAWPGESFSPYRGLISSLPALCLAAFAFCVLMGLWWFFAVRRPRRASREAARYFSQSAVLRLRTLCLGPALLVGGGVWRWLRPDFWSCFTVALGVFLLVAGFAEPLLERRFSVRAEDVPDPYDRKRELRRAVLRWAVYWVFCLGAFVAVGLYLKNFSYYLPALALLGLNFILRLILHSPFRPYAGLRRRRVATLFLNGCILATLIFLTNAMLNGYADFNDRVIDNLDYSGFSHNSEVYYDRDTGVYTVRSTGDALRILQLTDIHLCSSLVTGRTDEASLRACYEVIRKAKPDLIIITGDLVFPIPLQVISRNNLLPLGHLCEFMDRVGIPWAFVYGNHDTESYAAYDGRELSGLLRYYSAADASADGSLLWADVQPDVYGRYNQYLRVENTDGTLNRLLFLMDSNDYVKSSAQVNEYDSVHPDQIQWYEDVIRRTSAREGRVVPSFVFMHIPFKEFADAKAALDAGRAEAEYLFGANGEGVSHPDRDSGFFARIRDLGSTQAVFVGHDHLNDLAVKYQGVDLVYSRSIDYIAYPGIEDVTGHRGGTLITLSSDGGYRIEQIVYDK